MRDKGRAVRAGQDDLPPRELQQLARDSDPRVRRVVAARDDVPTSLLTALGRDDDRDTRTEVARNPRTPPPALRRLVTDPEYQVRAAVARRDDVLGDDDLRRLAADRRLEVRAAVAMSHVAPLAILEPLTRDRSVGVRWTIAMHQRHVGLLAMLYEDVDADVATTARSSSVAQPVRRHRRNGGWDLDDGSLHRT